MASQDVLVFEPSLSGHRGYYAGIQASALLELGVTVHLAVPENALELPEGAAFLGDVMPHVHHVALPPSTVGGSAISIARNRFDQLRSTIERVPVDHCYVPYADGLAQVWGMQRRPGKCIPKNIIIEGLMMRGRFAYPQQSIRERISATLSYVTMRRSGFTRLHHLDPIAFQRIGRHGSVHRLIPEIIDTDSHNDVIEARSRLGLDPSAIVITSPGAVSETKGCDRLLRAVASLPRESNVRLVLLGKHTPPLREQIERLDDDRVLSIDRFATVEEFSDLFSAADFVAACYPRHVGSSSIVLRAATAGKPVIGSNWGWIGWATDTFDLGRSCDAVDANSIREAILWLLNEQPCQTNPDLMARRRRLIDYHQTENHVAHWTDLLRERLGLAPMPKRSMGQDVMPHPQEAIRRGSQSEAVGL